MLLLHLMSISQEAVRQPKVRKLGAGKYSIDNRTVSVRWTPQAGAAALPSSSRDTLELLAREQDDDGRGMGEEMPLVAYLSSAANVSASLRGRSPGAPAVA